MDVLCKKIYTMEAIMLLQMCLAILEDWENSARVYERYNKQVDIVCVELELNIYIYIYYPISTLKKADVMTTTLVLIVIDII